MRDIFYAIGLCTLCFSSAVALIASHSRSSVTAYRQEMNNYRDLQYYGNMTVGTQTLKVVLDTGSIDFVVLSTKCVHWCGTRQLYDAQESATYLNGSLSLVLSYGSGSLLGREAYETVKVGPLTATSVPFWEVFDASMPLLLKSEFEAIIGLGPMQPGTTIMQPGDSANEMSFAVLFKKLGVTSYSVCLGKEPHSSGFLTWNDETPQQYPDDFVKLEIPSDTGYWMAKLEDVYLGDKYIDCSTLSAGCGAVIDSGTSLLAAPLEAYSELMASVDGLAGDCENINMLPELHFKLNGIRFTLPPDAYLGNVHGKVSKTIGQHFQKRARKCQGALMHVSMDSAFGPVWILGMPFFRKFYTVFSQGGANSPPALYTTLATDECYPANSTQQGLLSMGRRVVQAARTIDASELRLPMWLHRMRQTGKLDDGIAAAKHRQVFKREPGELDHPADAYAEF